MTHVDIAKHIEALAVMAAEGFAANQRRFDDGMVHIALLAEGGVVPVELATGRRPHDAAATEPVVQAA